ncbi:MAG: energy transducer TonB [Burkholderiaceae bacterium]|jgi:protein TonB|nr:energy transducer TonB [Burkholderiaceae bacterium]
MNLGKLSTLQIALGLSVAVHGALLAMHLAAPQSLNRVFDDTSLEVILVNAKTDKPERPEKAQAIAQSALAGGGDLDQGRAASPLPSASFSASGDYDENAAQRQIQTMQEKQMLLLARLKQQLLALPKSDPQQLGDLSEQSAQEQKRKQLLDLLAQIERRISEENARPSKHYLSPSTREAAYAVYVDALHQRIEERGMESFPEVNGQKLYGELTLLLTVNHDGSVLSTEIVRSSGTAALDRRAQAIVQSIRSFGPFTAAMREQADQLVLVLNMKFWRDGTMQTQVAVPTP